MFEKEFRSLACDFASRLGFAEPEFSFDEKHAVAAMEKSGVKLEAVLKYSSLGGVKNVLFARFYPNRMNRVFYLLPEAFFELEIPEYRSTFFSMIESPERLESCFGQLALILEEHLPLLIEAASDGRLPWARTVTKDDPVERQMVFADPDTLDREPFVIYGYTLEPQYRALLEGDTEKAKRIFARKLKKGDFYVYQTRLYEYLCGEPRGFEPMPDACNAVKALRGLERENRRLFALSLLMTFAAFSALFIAAKLVFDAFFARGTVHVFGMPWYACFLPAALPTIFVTAALRKRFIPRLSRKNGGALLAFDRVQNTPVTHRLAKAFAGLSLGFAAAVFAICCAAAVRVYPDRLDAPQDGDLFRREQYLFSDVLTVCHIAARYNSDGERLNFGSYVLIMKDGRLLDLYGSTSEKETEKHLLPLLSGIEVTEIDSDLDLEAR